VSETNNDPTAQPDLLPADSPAEQERSQRAEPQEWIGVSASYRGPIPPDMLRGYNDVVDGAADRILRLWESEAAHRRRTESRSQWFGFILSGMAILLASALVYAGLGYPAAIIGLVGLGPVGLALSSLRRGRRQDNSSNT
jgi:uncharacterized membrane protein